MQVLIAYGPLGMVSRVSGSGSGLRSSRAAGFMVAP